MKRPIVATLACLLSACGSPLAPDIPVRLIGHGGLIASNSGVVVIRENWQWEAFVRQVGLRPPSGLPDAPLPAVNFPDEMTLGIFLGSRPSSAYRVRVDRVVRDRSAIVVHAIEEIACVGLTVITSPLTAVAMPSSTTSIEVVWSVVRLPCS